MYNDIRTNGRRLQTFDITLSILKVLKLIVALQKARVSSCFGE